MACLSLALFAGIAEGEAPAALPAAPSAPLPGQHGYLDRGLAGPRGGITRVVQNCNDSGSGSLREAYLASGESDVVDLSQLACSTITLVSGELQSNGVQAYVTIEADPERRVTIDANHAGRAFQHAGGRLQLSHLVVQGGRVHDAAGGGCVRSFGDVVLRGTDLVDCEVSTSGITPARGGAVQADAVVFVIGGSRITGNRAHADAADADGGGVHARYVIGAHGSTISGNTASGDGTHYARGGGVYGQEGVRMDDCTLSGNLAGSGGGAFIGDASFYNSSFSNSTVSQNQASGAGGGIFSWFATRLDNSTVAGNRAVFDFGAGLYLAAGNATIRSSIVANNTSGDGLDAADIGGHAGATIAGDHSLVIASTLALPPDTLVEDPLLGPLQDNGGQVLTHALLPGSPAIDRGDNPRSLYTDARGYDCSGPSPGCVPFERTVGAATDIGAFEFGAPDAIFGNGFDGES
ncbi:MAG TPA: choice-of-anchor Q domain-containing protein [Dokdonella sp.]